MQKETQNSLISKYRAIGKHNFYHFLLANSISKLVYYKNDNYTGTPPALELLEQSQYLLMMYRRSCEEDLIEMSKIFRRAAHKIYLVMLKKDLMIKSDKFLNLVK